MDLRCTGFIEEELVGRRILNVVLCTKRVVVVVVVLYYKLQGEWNSRFLFSLTSSRPTWFV